MKCIDCPYFWKDDDNEIAYCHYQYNDGYAPCEVEDAYEEPCDDAE